MYLFIFGRFGQITRHQTNLVKLLSVQTGTSSSYENILHGRNLKKGFEEGLSSVDKHALDVVCL